jgi:Porin subfamily
MIRNCLCFIVVATLSASPLMAQSSISSQSWASQSWASQSWASQSWASPKAPAKRAPDKVLPMKGTATVNSCAAYGPGFVKVEGTDTCVQIGGSIGIGVGGSVTGRR